MNVREQEMQRGAGSVEPTGPDEQREAQAGLELDGVCSEKARLKDITARKWAETVLAGEKRVLEMIARGSSLCSILDEVCLVVEGLSNGSLCSILLLDTAGERLCHGAAPNLPESYTRAVDGSVIGPTSGPCGRAAYHKQPVIVCDTLADPTCQRYRDLASAHGLGSCWSAPILSSEGKVLGTFAIYSREPRAPTPQHLSSIEQFAHLASIAIERTQSQDALRTAKARFEGILEIADDAIISVDAGQRIVLFNQGAERVFGYGAPEVIGKPLEVLLPERFAHSHRGHMETFASAPEVSRSMGERREVFGRRKDGSEFPAEASISKLDLGKEMVFTVILRDVTERKQAAEALRASAQLARGQMEALSRSLDALAMESAPDRIVEHVLRTIISQLDAHSSAVWLRDEATGLVSFESALENGTFATKSDAALAKICPALKVEDVWPWPEIFRTGKPSVMEDIR
jgi:PAS domain S-box-containing protein